MTKGEDDGAKKPGVFAKLHAMKAQSTAAKVGTPATQNPAAANVLTSRVMAKKPAPSPILGKDEMDAGSAQGQGAHGDVGAAQECLRDLEEGCDCLSPPRKI